MDESTLPESVTKLAVADREIYLIGTAHISKRSVAEVEALIRDVRPDTVCVELDESRHKNLLDAGHWRELNIFQIIRDKKVLLLLVNLVLTTFQRRMGEKLGVQPGAELKAAVLEAKACDAKLVLADRDIQVTLKRAWRSLGFWNKVQVIGALFSSFFTAEEISEADIEKLRERDHVSEAMGNFVEAMPALQRPLIDERDQYLMSMVREAPGTCIVAVVGAGHVAGMLRYRDAPIDREALSHIPPATGWTRLLPWLIPALMLAAFYFGYRQHAGEKLSDMLVAWVLPNAIAAALFTVLAGGRALTVLVSLLGSPVTSLNPTIGVGMVAGFVEAWLRKPTVADCEGIHDAMRSLRDFYKNRLTRVLLVAAMASLGSSLGALIGGGWVLSLL
ncbi:MAG: TraB/GumN family protein [Polyangiales bacterium]